MSGLDRVRMSDAMLDYWIDHQRKWIDQCGGSLAGYQRKYAASHRKGLCGSPEEIYWADAGTLTDLLNERARRATRQRGIIQRRAAYKKT